MIPLLPDPRAAKIKAYTQYQIYCVIPAVVSAVLPHGQAIDARHARNAALFRVAVSVLGLLGIVGLEIRKLALKKAISADTAMRPNEPTPPGVWPPSPSA